MGLKKSTIIKAVASAFKGIGELVGSCTYRRTATVYTPGTGSVKTNTDYTVPITITGYSQFEIDRVNILSTDSRGLIQQKDLSVTPVVATDTVISKGKTYNIIRYTQDPAGAIWTLHLRAP